MQITRKQVRTSLDNRPCRHPGTYRPGVSMGSVEPGIEIRTSERAHRLGQETVHAGVQALVPVLVAGIGGHRHYGHLQPPPPDVLWLGTQHIVSATPGGTVPPAASRSAVQGSTAALQATGLHDQRCAVGTRAPAAVAVHARINVLAGAANPQKHCNSRNDNKAITMARPRLGGAHDGHP